MLYYVETDQGCGIREATNITQARSRARKEVGENNVKDVRRATEEDISWVRGMGGRIPEDKRWPR